MRELENIIKRLALNASIEGSGKAVSADKADSVKFIGFEGGRVVYEVGSGWYQLRIAYNK